MSDERGPCRGWSPGMFAHLDMPKNPDAPPAKSARKKRRRKGQLNDGEWAPGYGPDAKKPARE